MNIKEEIPGKIPGEIPEEEIYPDSLNPFADDLDPPNKENEQIENFLDDNCKDNTNNSYPDDFNPFQEEPKIGKHSMFDKSSERVTHNSRFFYCLQFVKLILLY